MSSSSFKVETAGQASQLLSANDVVASGQVTAFTQWLNEEGFIEADLTVTKLGDERYWSWCLRYDAPASDFRSWRWTTRMRS